MLEKLLGLWARDEKEWNRSQKQNLLDPNIYIYEEASSLLLSSVYYNEPIECIYNKINSSKQFNKKNYDYHW